VPVPARLPERDAQKASRRARPALAFDQRVAHALRSSSARLVGPTGLERDGLTHRSVLQLQRSLGNEAVTRALASPSPSPSPHGVSVQRDTSTSGAQLDVQKKMAEITRLFREKELQGKDPEATESPGPAEDVDEDADETEVAARDTTSAYAWELAINGLCGGWATLFMQYRTGSSRSTTRCGPGSAR
jgi:hypothetical protein